MMKEKNNTKIPFVFIAKVLILIIIIALVFYVDGILNEGLSLQLIKGISTFLIPSIGISVIRVLIISLYNARHANRTVRGNFVLGVNRLTTMINVILIIIGIMISFNINPLDFLTSLTIVAMAIAVLFRDYITNMLSGLYIMFSEQLSVGDRIRMGEHKGRIVDVTFGHIELQNEEDDIVMIPNNLVFTNPMLNLSAHRSNLFTVKFELPLPGAMAVDVLEKEIQNVMRNHPNLDAEHDIVLQVLEMAHNYVRYKVELHAVSSSNRLHKQLENELLRHLLMFENNMLKSSSL